VLEGGRRAHPPHGTPISWLRVKLLPERYGPITATGHTVPLMLRSRSSPSCATSSLEWSLMGWTMANLRGAHRCRGAAIIRKELWDHQCHQRQCRHFELPQTWGAVSRQGARRKYPAAAAGQHGTHGWVAGASVSTAVTTFRASSMNAAAPSREGALIAAQPSRRRLCSQDDCRYSMTSFLPKCCSLATTARLRSQYKDCV
jgi:hypothetical protein